MTLGLQATSTIAYGPSTLCLQLVTKLNSTGHSLLKTVTQWRNALAGAQIGAFNVLLSAVAFYRRNAVLARVLAMALCLSVCLSVFHKSVSYRKA